MIIWIASMIIFFLVLHWVIRSAINSSRPAQQFEELTTNFNHFLHKETDDSEIRETLKEIRDLLKSEKK
ncbi:MAG TPA: hypothetical protein VFT51_03325 [Bacillales bacterium]|nr:hypothetical protein [Bacillales bacterium]